MKDYIHNGDVLLFPVDNVSGKIVKGNGEYNVLAEGEITGHCHVVPGIKSKIFRDERNIMYIEITEPCDLEHIDIHTGEKADHNTIIVPPGKYQIGRVKEYDPFEKEIREVQD